MEDTWSNKYESVNDSDNELLYSKKTIDPSGQFESVEESNNVDGTIEDYKDEGRRNDLEESDWENEHASEDWHNTIEKIDNKGFRRKILYDGTLKTPPKIISTPSQDESLEQTLEAGGVNLSVNTKALPKEATTYELQKFKKNYLVIFNQVSIDGYEPRLGSNEDVLVLTKTFKNYGFDIEVHKDPTKAEIIEALEKFNTMNFTDYGCVGVIVLTHGSFNGTLRAKDETYNETDILKYFRVYDKPTLITKPKFLLIQACRGTQCLPATQVLGKRALKKDLDEEVAPYTLPAMSDVLIVHSSYAGEVSTRDELYGSWFIQTLCSKINEMASSHDLESILIEVKREVAATKHWEDYNRKTRRMEIHKQMPTVISTLIRKLYLRKFSEESAPMTFVDYSKPMISTDSAMGIAVSPILCQFGPCSCFLDHFDYIRKCLTYFVEENPCDATARTFLEISNAFENENQFNAAKERMAQAICEHLNYNARHCDFFKFLYFYKHRSL